jgi:hypothetical protein|tara:strand:- start:42 stop:308 length:267 start_codon:yes stop_codon:yes gene_type:complete
MPLKPQSIRKNMLILANNEPISKEELITMSQLWTETQERFFRKMLKQGGKFKVNNVHFSISLKQDARTRSDNTKDSGIIQIPGESGKF